MNKFAELLDRLAYEPGRNNKLRLIADCLRTTPDPERGFALAALTGALSFQHAKPGDTILLAPACASFDQFRSFEHRGEVFKQIVNSLQSKD